MFPLKSVILLRKEEKVQKKEEDINDDALYIEMLYLLKAIREGKMDVRADIDRAQERDKEFLKTVNRILDSVVGST
jgi:hypothetical protein